MLSNLSINTYIFLTGFDNFYLFLEHDLIFIAQLI